MGNNSFCCQNVPQPKTVTYLANNLPDDDKYKHRQSESVRFSEVSCRKSDKNIYIFSMSIVNEVDIHAEIPVLTELSDCFRSENYELKFGSKAIIDIFNKNYTNTFLEAKNEKTSMEYSVKIIPFKSYTSKEFKKAFYELWINEKLGVKALNVVKLVDYFIYGMIPDLQAFVLIFQRCTTSLANIAEYRKESGYKWNQQEKLKVLHQIIESYQNLYKKNIVHRDLRPSNIFFCEASGKFCIGNFSNARLIRRMQEDDLMSVCGTPFYSCQQVKSLAQRQQSIGFYEGIKQDFCGLKSIFNIIQTCDLLDGYPNFNKNQKQIIKIHQMISNNENFSQILDKINQFTGKKSVDLSIDTRDRQISTACSFLLAHKYKSLIQDYVFNTYGLLGYNKQFSNKAHQMMEINNQTDNQLQNAPILKRLGQFYEQKGTSGLQYFYNAFTLYLIRSQKQLKYGYPQKSEQQLDEAKQVYLKFSQTIQSEMPRIQLNRISALIELDKKNIDESQMIIDTTFRQAAKENLPIQKQCKMLLAYGEIYKLEKTKREQALKKLITGLAICENSSAFQSPASCRIFKSNFLYLIGCLHMDEMLSLHNPKKHRNQQVYGIDLKSKIQTHLKSSLQIRQREIVDDMDISECLIELGYFYYHDESFYDAKKYFDRAFIRLNQLTGKVNPMKQVKTCYMKGSSSYYLNQFEAAHRDYDICLKILDKVPESKKKQLLIYNIEGDIGLAQMQLGISDGRSQVEKSMLKIKQLEGQYSYDYACLRANYYKISK